MKIPKELRDTVLSAIEDLFGQTSAKLLGRYFDGNRLYFSVARTVNPLETIEGMYRYAYHLTSPNTQPDPEQIQNLAEITGNYIEAQKLKIKNQIEVGLSDAKTEEEAFDLLEEKLNQAQSYMSMLTANETKLVQAFATKDGITQVAASLNDSDPILTWRGVIDSRMCLVKGSKVLTTDGPVCVEDLTEKHWILSHRSITDNKAAIGKKFHSRLLNKAEDVRDCVSVELDDGRKIECSKDHPILLRMGQTCFFWEASSLLDERVRALVEVVTAEELTFKDRLSISMAQSKGGYSDLWDFIQKIRGDVVRLYLEGNSYNKVAEILGIGSKQQRYVLAILKISGVFDAAHNKLWQIFLERMATPLIIMLPFKTKLK